MEPKTYWKEMEEERLRDWNDEFYRAVTALYRAFKNWRREPSPDDYELMVAALERAEDAEAFIENIKEHLGGSVALEA